VRGGLHHNFQQRFLVNKPRLTGGERNIFNWFSVYVSCFAVGMHRISGPIIGPFLKSGIRPDTRLPCRISGKAGYRISSRIYG
jgi:hypothetical protein